MPFHKKMCPLSPIHVLRAGTTHCSEGALRFPSLDPLLSRSLQDSAHLNPDLPQPRLFSAGLPGQVCQHGSFLPCKTSAISNHDPLHLTQLPQVSLPHPSKSVHLLSAVQTVWLFGNMGR